MKLILITLATTALFIPAVHQSDRAPDSLSTAEGCGRAGAEYVGQNSCKKCHFSQHRSWKKTKMALTFEVLKPGQAKEAKAKHGLDANKDYTKDASCLPCHTTGYGKPGGFPAVVEGKSWTSEEKDRASNMEGVQCEACHGPGSKANVFKKNNENYKKAEVLALGMIEADAANCKTCHNESSPTIEKGYKFDHAALTKDDKKIHKHKALKHKH